MVEKRRDLGWLGVLVGMAALVVLVLGILVALGARTAARLRQPADLPATQVTATLDSAASTPEAPPTAQTAQVEEAQASDLAAVLRDGEAVQVEFASGLSLAGLVQIENGVVTILNPLGAAIDLGEVALLVQADGQTLVPADFGFAAAVATPAPTLAVASPTTSTVSIAAPAATDAPGQAIAVGGDVAVSAILDQYPEGTLFRATLQTGEEVLAVKQNRLTLARVDPSGGATGKTIVPPWMIVRLEVVL